MEEAMSKMHRTTKKQLQKSIRNIREHIKKSEEVMREMKQELLDRISNDDTEIIVISSSSSSSSSSSGEDEW